MWPGTGREADPVQSAGFRSNPQQHAGTGAIGQEKTPTEHGWGFVIGGAGGNRTRVRKPSTDSSTYLVWLFDLIFHPPTDKRLQDELPWI